MTLSTADSRMTSRQVQALVGDVLDTLDITDSIYHDLSFTRPLVEELVMRVARSTNAGDRILLMGGNSLLGASLTRLDCQLDIWRFGENLLNDAVVPYVRGAVTPDEISRGCLPFGAARYDAVVLPLIFESIEGSPEVPLGALRSNLAQDGVVIVATHNLANLGLRMRALAGRNLVLNRQKQDIFFSVSWPAVPEHQYYLQRQLAEATYAAGYVPAEAAFVGGRTMFEPDATFGPTGALSRIVKHQLKSALPSLREYIAMTLRRPTAEELRLGWSTPQDGAPEPEADPYQPTVTVVVPTHNRATELADCFSGLVTQTYPLDKWDVVLVNDNSKDNTDEVVAGLMATVPFKLRYFRTPGLGAAGARNFGMRQATGEIVAHLDDDNRPTPEWLEEAVRGFADPSVCVVGGPVRPKPEQPGPFLSFTANYVIDQGVYPTSNIFYRRAVADAAGGFDESFGKNLLGRPVPGWDADLGWRMRHLGYTGKFRPGVVAYQEVVPQTLKEWLMDPWRLSLLPETVRRVPELGEFLLHKRLFLSTASPKFYAAAAGVLLCLRGRNPLPLALTVPWLGFLYKSLQPNLRRPTTWPNSTVRGALVTLRMVITTIALLRGSIRSKRPVL